MKEFWKKFLKKADYIWEYYKWHIIVPVLVIAIIVCFVDTYIRESRPISLGIAIMNTSDVDDAILAFSYDYAEYRNIDIKKLPIKTEINFVHPKDMQEAAREADDTVASIQKYQTMMVNDRIDVTFTTYWVVEEYTEIAFYEDLRNVYDAAFLEEIEEKILYVTVEGEEIPLGIYVEECDVLRGFTDGNTPVMAFSKGSERLDEAGKFGRWVLDWESRTEEEL